MELKFNMLGTNQINLLSSNRTFMELKSASEPQKGETIAF